MLRQALERDPENLSIYSQLARSARQRGDHDSEAAVYREILEARPHHHSTLMALADVQIGQDDMEGAIRTLSEVVAHYPDDLPPEPRSRRRRDSSGNADERNRRAVVRGKP